MFAMPLTTALIFAHSSADSQTFSLAATTVASSPSAT
jgi:hypothetical protein